MSDRRTKLIFGSAAAFLATGLIPLVNSPVAHAICAPDDAVGCDPDFIFNVDKLFSLFGVTDIEAADPGDHFDAMVMNIPSLGITDVLTSGADPSDALAGLGVTLPDDTGIGMAGVTVNTFVDSMDPALDSSFTIPFMDPLGPLWDFLVQNAFFGL